jgi:hypothetical protein
MLIQSMNESARVKINTLSVQRTNLSGCSSLLRCMTSLVWFTFSNAASRHHPIKILRPCIQAYSGRRHELRCLSDHLARFLSMPGRPRRKVYDRRHKAWSSIDAVCGVSLVGNRRKIDIQADATIAGPCYNEELARCVMEPRQLSTNMYMSLGVWLFPNRRP